MLFNTFYETKPDNPKDSLFGNGKAYSVQGFWHIWADKPD